MAGFVKLNRSLLEWAWADDAVTLGMYAKLLLLAAWKDTEYHGVKLERGELLTNQSEIAQQSGLSRQQVRTVLDRLKSTNKITIRREGKNSIVKVIDCDCETDGNHINNHTSTTCQPDSNQTSLLSKEYKEVKELKNARMREGERLEDRFNRFWVAYPRKTAKQQALKAWQKLKPDEGLTDTILSALERFKQTEQWRKDNGRFIPYPATWLNGKRWEDETMKVKQNGTNSGNNGMPTTEAEWLEGFEI